MALRYVFDEHLRGPLWRAVVWHNSSGVYPLDRSNPVVFRLRARSSTAALFGALLGRCWVLDGPMQASLAVCRGRPYNGVQALRARCRR